MIRLAVIGAHGLVGRTILDIVEERRLRIDELALIGRESDAPIEWNHGMISIQTIERVDFSTIDAALNAAGRDVSLRWTERIAGDGCLLVDNSSAFRQVPDVPLVVPELNGDLIGPNDRVVANPNCTTIQIALALDPLHRVFGLEQIDITTLQSASGAGRTLMEQLRDGTGALPGNVLPSIGELDEYGRSEEERKIETELPRILGLDGVSIASTTTRVPVQIGHGAAVHLRLATPASTSRVVAVLQDAPGIRIVDERERPGGPTPAEDAAGQNNVLIGRIRTDPTDPRRLQLWIVADNLRRGAALNAVLILERLLNVNGVNATV
jgi:aspartate-semialdehyde dehydrogenase